MVRVIGYLMRQIQTNAPLLLSKNLYISKTLKFCLDVSVLVVIQCFCNLKGVEQKISTYFNMRRYAAVFCKILEFRFCSTKQSYIIKILISYTNIPFLDLKCGARIGSRYSEFTDDGI